MHRPSGSRGFTLVEVLVALVVMSILAGLAWQAVDGMVRSRQVVDERMQRSLTLSTALAQWEIDLQQVVTEAPVPSLHFDGVRVRMARRAPEGIQLVVWSLRQGQWQRWAAPPTPLEADLIRYWAGAGQLLGREPGHLTLAEGVGTWQVFFFRGNAWSNAQSAGDLVSAGVQASQGNTTGLPNRERLPTGVRLVLNFQGAAGAQTLTRDILVPGGQP